MAPCLFELKLGVGLLRGQSTGGNIRHKVILTSDGAAGQAAQHGDLADMCKSVGGGNYFFSRLVALSSFSGSIQATSECASLKRRNPASLMAASGTL